MNKTIQLVFNDTEKYVLVIVKGILRIPDIELTFKQIISSSEYQQGMKRIWDLSEADLSELDADKVKTATEIPSTFIQGKSSSKVALVSNRDINMALLKLFKVYSIDDKSKIEIFTSLEEAKNW